jgi:hypothetical protein
VGLTLTAAPAWAQFFSPGPLARPHASLEGLASCNKCHEQQKGLSARLCLDCHQELAGRVARGNGFHGRLPPAKRAECQGCHPDHRGRELQLVDWEVGRDRFDHRKTGWPLEGTHARTTCNDCHQRPLVVDPAIRQMLDRKPARSTMLGLSTRCNSCHFDEHRGQLGPDCQKCHGETVWKPTARFNHQTTAYPLQGKHRDVACAKCHPGQQDERTPADAFPRPRATAFMEMKPIDHRTCASCHDDPHRGGFGPACASCHSEAAWKIILTGGNKNTAFHEKTRYPLRGAHIGVACRSCHGPAPGQPARFKGLPFAACSDCHEDAHLGQLQDGPRDTTGGPREGLARRAPPGQTRARGRPPDCAGCHTVNGFSPARYELEQHAATRFPLEGAHETASCRGCHPVDRKLESRVSPVVRKKLRGERRPELWSFVVMQPRRSPQACAACHADVHRGQLAGEKTKDTCSRCHRTTSFTDLSFDHDRDSRFPLTGKHARTPCAACHETERRGGQPVVRYKPIETACARCHADYHLGQFSTTATSSEGGPRKARQCDFCHQTASFKETLFAHNDGHFSSYPLEGKHAQVKCQSCHPTVRLGPEMKTVRYRPLPGECEGCHADYHKGEFRGFEP